MRIFVITDVHANLPALDASLAAIEREGADLIVHTGDVIGVGPFPAECLDRLLCLGNVQMIMGNHDEYFAHGLQEKHVRQMGEGELQHQKWTHAQLDSNLRAVMRKWPYQATHTWNLLTVTFLHYPMKEGGEFLPILKAPSAAEMDRAFADYRGDLICYGHHHPFSDIKGYRRYINPGSLGCAPSAIARFCRIDVGRSGWSLSHQSVPYDDTPVYQAFEERKVPGRKFLYQAFFGGRFES